jgi:hypothetical protein
MAKGGARKGAGRKSKAEEMGLQGKLDPMERDFLNALHQAIKKGNPIALKLFAEYRYGKPQDNLDITSGGEKLTALVRFKDAE